MVGWDGYVYPYTFNIDDFEPVAGRIHMPPPVHQTFQGPNFVICSFCPRMLDWQEDSIPIPYNHSNLQSEEMIYYVSGEFSSRRGVDVGAITLHPSGLPHGPQPGLAEKSIGTRFTAELAVMCDTFRPLQADLPLPGARRRCLRAVVGPRSRRRPSPMFKEAQLYAPVTTAADGSVTVHLSDDHPGVADPEYRARRNHIASLALDWDPSRPVPHVEYTEAEEGVWRTVCRELAVKHERLACAEYQEAMARLALPVDRIPQLDEVSERLRPLTGFQYHPAAGLVPFDQFYGSLADSVFHSTQYVRHHALPLYTPEPDLIHEVIGHGGTLASPRLAELNRLAGQAARRLQTKAGRDFFATVFWFTIEFGVLYEHGELRAYGAGLLSSYGEIDEFRGADIRPLDIGVMGTQKYDITKYQPVLFAADGLEQLLDVVGSFFAECDDDSPARLHAHVAA